MVSDVSGAPAITTKPDACTNQDVFMTDVTCMPLSAPCDSNQFDVTRSRLQTSTFNTQCGTPVYTKDRECQCLTKCGLHAKEVWAPATFVDPQAPGVVRYEGDRICQCPDPISQSDGLDFLPLFSKDVAGFTALAAKGTTRGLEYAPADIPAFEPNVFAGTWCERARRPLAPGVPLWRCGRLPSRDTAPCVQQGQGVVYVHLRSVHKVPRRHLHRPQVHARSDQHGLLSKQPPRHRRRQH
jgi:hypothetical protein